MAHRLAFSQFQSYDDEGYLLITVKQFLQGKPLYDDVYTQYGPAYYFWQELLHSVFRIPLTHDATRVVTILMWAAASTLTGALVWLLTERRLLGALGGIAAFFHLIQLTFEPGHPQELCLLSTLAAIVLTTWRLTARARLGRPAAIILGAMVSVVLLTKLNIGAFLAGGLSLAMVTSLENSGWRRVLLPLATIAVMLAAPGLVFRDILRADIATWVVVVWCSLAATVVVSRAVPDTEESVRIVDLAFFAIGLVVTSFAIIGLVLSRGTSPHALFNGLLVWPLGLSRVFWMPLPVPWPAAIVAAASLAMAWMWRRASPAAARLAPFLALGLAPAVVVMSAVKAYGGLLAFAPPLAWLLVRRSDGNSGNAPRRVLAFVAILMTLQAYPMPNGTQIVLGTVLFGPIALVAFVDAERQPGPGRPSASSRTRLRQAAFMVLAVVVTAAVALRYQRVYASAIPLELSGSSYIHAPARQVALYRWLTINLRSQCDRFMSAPGLNSLYFWTGVPPVSTLNATLWPILFDAGQQRRVMENASVIDRLCVVWAPRETQVMERTVPEISERPLYGWLAREFVPRAAFDGWEIRMRRDQHAVLTYQARWSDASTLVIEVPAVSDSLVTRLVMIDLNTDAVIADSEADHSFSVIDEQNLSVGIANGLNVSKPRRFLVRSAASLASASSSPAVVQLWGRDGELLALLPVVSVSANN